ncbi:unnamed protein product [Ranitomeya imitator]|uniref:Uncharacterized protein n=1 Tax=Ranitomeya imitator TaxID=111125 RepID=A0ABN9LE49_9NEOB|nr:unnamed protein product [Ranitomeya imitator]
MSGGKRRLLKKKLQGSNFLELVELAEKALTSLPYHRHFPLVRKFIHICSNIYSSAQSGPVLLEESQKVLLRMMSNWVPAVRAEAYNCCLDIVKTMTCDDVAVSRDRYVIWSFRKASLGMGAAGSIASIGKAAGDAGSINSKKRERERISLTGNSSAHAQFQKTASVAGFLLLTVSDGSCDSLGVHNVTKPVSSICNGINFLLHPKVLYEVATFGLQDSNNEVCLAAKAVLTYFLQGRLVMTPSSWNKFIEALCPVLPLLQGFADTEEALGNSIVALCETSERGEGVLPKTTLLKAAVRFLFSKRLTLRTLGIKWLSVHLMNEKESNCKRPELQGNVLSKAVSLYIAERSVDLKLDDKETSFFKVGFTFVDGGAAEDCVHPPIVIREALPTATPLPVSHGAATCIKLNEVGLRMGHLIAQSPTDCDGYCQTWRDWIEFQESDGYSISSDCCDPPFSPVCFFSFLTLLVIDAHLAALCMVSIGF